MVTMAQRIEALRTEKGLSRPALAAALGLPRLSIEKFETGRQTPSQEQQQKLAGAFGVSLPYLRGETDDPTSMDNWLSGAVPQEDVVLPKAVRKATAAVVAQSGDSSRSDGAVFSALLKSDSFKALVISVPKVMKKKNSWNMIRKKRRPCWQKPPKSKKNSPESACKQIRGRFYSSFRNRSAAWTVLLRYRMTSTGHFPTAVSPVTITAAAPSATALKISLTSARVGTGLCSMDASICVTTMKGFPALRHWASIRFWAAGIRSIQSSCYR